MNQCVNCGCIYEEDGTDNAKLKSKFYYGKCRLCENRCLL